MWGPREQDLLYFCDPGWSLLCPDRAHTPICAQNCKISPEVYVISPDNIPIKGKCYTSAFSHGISIPISHWHTKPALLFHNIFLSVLRRIHISDWDWGAMKTSAAILFAEDSRHSFQN